MAAKALRVSVQPRKPVQMKFVFVEQQIKISTWKCTNYIHRLLTVKQKDVRQSRLRGARLLVTHVLNGSLFYKHQQTWRRQGIRRTIKSESILINSNIRHDLTFRTQLNAQRFSFRYIDMIYGAISKHVALLCLPGHVKW